MKFLADENFPLASYNLLRKNEIDVLFIAFASSGISDVEIMDLAMKENRTILTFDRDFGQLIFLENFHPEGGVVYFRWESFTPSEPAEYLLRIIEEDLIDFRNALTVIDRLKIRQKRYS